MGYDDAKAVALTILDLYISTNSSISNTCKDAADDTIRVKALYVMSLEAPISRWREPVQEAWVDYNDHLNVAYYTLIFDNAVDVFYPLCGLGQPYKEATGLSTFAVECHIGYQREGSLGDEVRVTSQLLGYDEKRLHYFHTMYHATEGYQMATQEQLAVHVDLSIRKVVPFTEGPLEKLAEMWEAHKDLPIPPQVGHVMKIPLPMK